MVKRGTSPPPLMNSAQSDDAGETAVRFLCVASGFLKRSLKVMSAPHASVRTQMLFACCFQQRTPTQAYEETRE
jgi:hypothetical protein